MIANTSDKHIMQNIMRGNVWLKSNPINVANTAGSIEKTLIRKVLPQYFCLSFKSTILTKFSSLTKREYSGVLIGFSTIPLPIENIMNFPADSKTLLLITHNKHCNKCTNTCGSN